MKIIFIVTGGLIIIFFIGWVGLQIAPKSFSALDDGDHLSKEVELSDNLPTQVKSFYEKVYGNNIPVVNTAVISGRGRMTISGITFPARFRFVHQSGTAYRHNIELTFFGFPIITVNEVYQEGKAKLELPFGIVENEPKVNQGANLALWGEAIWYPSVFLHDTRTRWKEADDNSALLEVPFGRKKQSILVRFDPDSELPHLLEAMRYKEANDQKKTLWLIETNGYKEINGHNVASSVAITWFDDGYPWAVFEVEDIVYNVDVEKFF